MALPKCQRKFEDQTRRSGFDPSRHFAAAPAIKAGGSGGHRRHISALLARSLVLIGRAGWSSRGIPSYWCNWRTACGGTKHEAGTALLARKSQNQLEDHTCGFLASCAVVASSLLPPFARAISKQEVLSGSELQKK